MSHILYLSLERDNSVLYLSLASDNIITVLCLKLVGGSTVMVGREGNAYMGVTLNSLLNVNVLYLKCEAPRCQVGTSWSVQQLITILSPNHSGHLMRQERRH